MPNATESDVAAVDLVRSSISAETDIGRSTTSKSRYFIPPHVHACATPDSVILLDVRHDRYVGISLSEASRLAELVSDWPRCPTATPPCDHTPVDELAATLQHEGLLVTNPSSDSCPRALSLTTTRSLTSIGYDLQGHATIQALDVLRFLSACIATKMALKHGTLEAALMRVQKRKSARGRCETSFDVSLATQLVCKFMRLRVYAYSAKDACLFHALCLMDFLAKYGVFPTFVIGVKTSPFAAHSWVQHDGYVLDATPEEVCFYTPIFAV